MRVSVEVGPSLVRGTAGLAGVHAATAYRSDAIFPSHVRKSRVVQRCPANRSAVRCSRAIAFALGDHAFTFELPVGIIQHGALGANGSEDRHLLPAAAGQAQQFHAVQAAVFRTW